MRASPGGDAAHGEIRSVLQTESRRLETFGKQCLSQPRKFYYSDDDDAELIKTSSLWGWLMAITRNKSLSPAVSLLSLESASLARPVQKVSIPFDMTHCMRSYKETMKPFTMIKLLWESPNCPG